jgi:hypothetical protein
VWSGEKERRRQRASNCLYGPWRAGPSAAKLAKLRREVEPAAGRSRRVTERICEAAGGLVRGALVVKVKATGQQESLRERNMARAVPPGERAAQARRNRVGDGLGVRRQRALGQ